MMRADALTAALAKLTVNAPRASTSGSLPAITWIASDEPLLALEAADQVRAASRQLGFTDRRVFHVERGFKLDALRHEANSLSLFANQQLLDQGTRRGAGSAGPDAVRRHPAAGEQPAP